MIHAFTTSAPHQLAGVVTLLESLRKHCPSFRLHWVVADRRDNAVVEGLPEELVDEIVFASDLQPAANPGWLFRHSVDDLVAAITPYAALDILSRDDCDRLLYFDHQTVVFSALDDLLGELEEASLVVSPHILHPMLDTEAIVEVELRTLRSGVFNIGFLGLANSSKARRFLRWWCDRRDCFAWDDLDRGWPQTEEWWNFCPVFFETSRILHEPRFNVSLRNIGERDLHGSFDEGLTVGRAPLGFFHFSGHAESSIRSASQDDDNRSNRVARMLVDWYQRRTQSLSPDVPPPWRLDLYDDGGKVEPQHRKVYRMRTDLQEAFPDPFDTRGKDLTFRKWLKIHGPDDFPDLLAPRDEAQICVPDHEVNL